MSRFLDVKYGTLDSSLDCNKNKNNKRRLKRNLIKFNEINEKHCDLDMMPKGKCLKSEYLSCFTSGYEFFFCYFELLQTILQSQQSIK